MSYDYDYRTICGTTFTLYQFVLTDIRRNILNLTFCVSFVYRREVLTFWSALFICWQMDVAGSLHDHLCGGCCRCEFK